MQTESNKNKEDYSFLRGLFTAKNPGKESRFALCAVLSFILGMALIIVFALHYLNIKITIGGVQALTGLATAILYKVSSPVIKKIRGVKSP